MNDTDLNLIWKKYDEKLEDLVSINKNMVNEIVKLKAKNVLADVKPFKYFGILVGIPFMVLFYFLAVLGIISGGFFFSLSFSAIAVITTIALGTYIYHLILINEINKSDSIIEVQEKLSKIKTSDLWSMKIAFLQAPFWSIFWLDIFPETSYIFYNLLIFSIIALGTLWLFINIKEANMEKKWMKILFSGSEWNAIHKAIDLTNQIQDQKHVTTES